MSNILSPMGKVIFAPIETITHNQFQQDEFLDQAKVQEIAESLKQYRDNGTKGLLQVTIGRRVNGRIEQAFGRHRLEAFKYLVDQGDPFFSEMPIIVQDLTDQEMFELMATENLKRRDISFIEEGAMYHTYMMTFIKNTVETAARFGKTEEHIRGRIMFVQLPEAAKEQARQGKVNVSLARGLVTTQKLMGAAGVEEVLNRLADDEADGIYDSPLEAIIDVLRDSPDLRQMGYKLSWLDLSGKKFPIKHLAPVSRKLVAELLDVQSGDVERKKLLDQVMQSLESGSPEWITDAQFPAFAPEQLDKVHVLTTPPACTACPFHATFDGAHYCGLKVCYERKEKAWGQAELEKIWKDIGIPLYVNEATDGKAVELSRWEKVDTKLFEERHADLRLKQTTRSVWNNFEGLPNNVVLVAVGKTAEKKLTANGRAVEKAQTEIVDQQMQSKIRNLTDEHVMRFLWDVAVPAFEQLLDSMSNLPFTLFLYTNVMFDAVDFPPGMDSKEEQVDQIQNARKKADALKQLRRLMIAEVLDRAIGWESYNRFGGTKKPLIEFSKRAQKYAEEWIWKLPKDWLKQAETYQAELDAALKDLKVPAPKVKA